MSKDKTDSPSGPPTPGPAPGLLRHEGAHRVTVAPGAHSALSSAPPTSGPRLRPKPGPIPASLRSGPPSPSGAATDTTVHRGTPVPDSRTAVDRTARRQTQHARWLPELGEPRAADQSASDLQERLDRLAKANAETSHKVVALERELKAAAPNIRSLS